MGMSGFEVVRAAAPEEVTRLNDCLQAAADDLNVRHLVVPLEFEALDFTILSAQHVNHLRAGFGVTQEDIDKVLAEDDNLPTEAIMEEPRLYSVKPEKNYRLDLRILSEGPEYGVQVSRDTDKIAMELTVPHFAPLSIGRFLHKHGVSGDIQPFRRPRSALDVAWIHPNPFEPKTKYATAFDFFDYLTEHLGSLALEPATTKTIR